MYDDVFNFNFCQLSQTTSTTAVPTTNNITTNQNQSLLSPDYQFINIFYRNALLQQHAQRLEYLRNTESIIEVRIILVFIL